MANSSNPHSDLENFDNYWSLGDPTLVEAKFLELLPQAEALKDKSIYLQLLSQVALAQAVQQKFGEAHATLDKAESLLTPDYKLAHVRILLERGRTYQQANQLDKAKVFFEKSYNLSSQEGFDAHTVNAAHMIAIIEDSVDQKIKWNLIGLQLAEKSKEGSTWLGSLYNNLGRNYMEAKNYAKALHYFEKDLEFEKQQGYAPRIRFAQWSIANALRHLGKSDQALTILSDLEKEYKRLEKEKTYDVPREMFNHFFGLVYEELSFVCKNKEKHYAHCAFHYLENDKLFQESYKDRFARLQKLSK